jgi:hypothetical protein
MLAPPGWTLMQHICWDQHLSWGVERTLHVLISIPSVRPELQFGSTWFWGFVKPRHVMHGFHSLPLTCVTCGFAQNVVLISIPSVMDPKLAPAGKHTLHAYLPATEPYSIWEGGPSSITLP